MYADRSQTIVVIGRYVEYGGLEGGLIIPSISSVLTTLPHTEEERGAVSFWMRIYYQVKCTLHRSGVRLDYYVFRGRINEMACFETDVLLAKDGSLSRYRDFPSAEI